MVMLNELLRAEKTKSLALKYKAIVFANPFFDYYDK
jgi:hypothetical protein